MKIIEAFDIAVERLREIESERARALGELLGLIDSMITLHDAGLHMESSVEKLRARRAAYDEADRAYRDARLA